MSKYSKWKVYRASFEPVVGSEQGKSRPVLIVSQSVINELLNCVNIVLISTHNGRQIYPNEVFLPQGTAHLENDSIALCHQIRTVDKRRLSLEYGIVEDDNIRISVLEAIKFQMGIE
ncbi:MAG: type II toxin-antitoxin system PemK/MazF family toxin [Bacteroidota bacterium]